MEKRVWDESHRVDSKRAPRNLYSDENPATTIKGCGFKNAEVAERTIKLMSQKGVRYKQYWTIRSMRERAFYHPNKTRNMEEAIKVFDRFLDNYKPPSTEQEQLKIKREFENFQIQAKSLGNQHSYSKEQFNSKDSKFLIKRARDDKIDGINSLFDGIFTTATKITTLPSSSSFSSSSLSSIVPLTSPSSLSTQKTTMKSSSSSLLSSSSSSESAGKLSTYHSIVDFKFPSFIGLFGGIGYHGYGQHKLISEQNGPHLTKKCHKCFSATNSCKVNNEHNESLNHDSSTNPRYYSKNNNAEYMNIVNIGNYHDNTQSSIKTHLNHLNCEMNVQTDSTKQDMKFDIDKNYHHVIIENNVELEQLMAPKKLPWTVHKVLIDYNPTTEKAKFTIFSTAKRDVGTISSFYKPKNDNLNDKNRCKKKFRSVDNTDIDNDYDINGNKNENENENGNENENENENGKQIEIINENKSKIDLKLEREREARNQNTKHTYRIIDAENGVFPIFASNRQLPNNNKNASNKHDIRIKKENKIEIISNDATATIVDSEWVCKKCTFKHTGTLIDYLNCSICFSQRKQ